MSYSLDLCVLFGMLCVEKTKETHMLTDQMIKRILFRKRLPVQAKYPAGRVIDMREPTHNLAYLKRVCAGVQAELAIPQEEMDRFYTEIAGKSRKQQMQIMVDWFGFIYVTAKDIAELD